MNSYADLNKDSIEGLTDLIQLNVDSVGGFQHVAKCVQSPVYRAAFLEIADERKRQVEELSQFVLFLEDETSVQGSYIAALHRALISVQDVIDHSNLSMIFAEIERGESYIIAAYQELLRDSIGSHTVRETLQRHLEGMEATQKSISSLREVIGQAANLGANNN